MTLVLTLTLIFTRWLPPDPAAGDGPLFHVLHDDGDEEDLEEDEVALTLALLALTVTPTLT